MKLYHQSVCQLAFFSLCCVLITVRESDSSPFVPGRCSCPETQAGVKGQLKELIVYPKSPICDKVTVIVTLRSNETVCLSPDGAMGTQLIRCWNRAHKLGRETKLCLRRRRRGRGRGQRQRSRQRSRSQIRKASSSSSQ
ncbi:C-X-C motif chemokine 9 [Sparus aurata]|uniref:C-X-C motif chemokine 9 n=1 Tax=Sparus aurata TaxID=8175 RepID=A0A0E3EKL8_SPAAU|nr:C-X-C motif chemokine 9-like [Sparus aurata]AIT82993.1 C-X-C motif chemokine 9 [Sparus aurata]